MTTARWLAALDAEYLALCPPHVPAYPRNPARALGVRP